MTTAAAGLGGRIWGVVNSPIVVGLAACALTALAARSYREEELKNLESTIKQLKKDSMELSTSYRSASDINREVLLLLVKREREMHMCHLQRNAIMADFTSSFCFWGHQHYKFSVLDVVNEKDIKPSGPSGPVT